MKNEEKFLITGLLVTILGYVLYKVWQPEAKQPLNGLVNFTFTPKEKNETQQEVKIPLEFDEMERLRTSVTASLRN